ncbi:Mov34/MPN/PAD-1 family protein [Pseudomonas neuropathica]|uniref:Mov34/MPN/PAD-1 family protein n=1 Tax=Pseudomonas neuropathica TaxID=2730425 RepID=UPI003EBA4052
MKWNNVKSDISAVQLKQITLGWTCFDLLRLISASKHFPIVTVSDETRSKILRHLNSDCVELGGLLLGSVVSSHDLEAGVAVVNIEDSIESLEFDSTSVSLSMDSTVWQCANAAKSSSSFVVGWYHSHPNLGAFFSGTDRKTQRDFFNQKYSVGLVIDPVRNEELWFSGSGSIEISPCNILTRINN